LRSHTSATYTVALAWRTAAKGCNAGAGLDVFWEFEHAPSAIKKITANTCFT
jgi:hypothetical protein